MSLQSLRSLRPPLSPVSRVSTSLGAAANLSLHSHMIECLSRHPLPLKSRLTTNKSVSLSSPLCSPFAYRINHRPPRSSSSSPLTTFLFMCANFPPTRYDQGLRAILARLQVLFPLRRPSNDDDGDCEIIPHPRMLATSGFEAFELEL